MNFNNISNDTKLRVRVPKALYESIQKELKKKRLNINEEYPKPGERGPFTGEMPESFEKEAQIRTIDSIITELEKVKEFLKNN
jgi:hypothetical protein